MKQSRIGDPKVFALDYVVTNVTHDDTVLHGECRLMLANIPFGDVGDRIYFDAVLRELVGLTKVKQASRVLPELPSSAEQLQALVESDLAGDHDFFWIAGFDDFIKLCFRQSDDLVVYWSLRPDVQDRAEYADYPTSVQKAVVSMAVIGQVAEDFAAQCAALLDRYQQDDHELAVVSYHAGKSVLPEDHVALFHASKPFVRRDGQVMRYAKDAQGGIHRYEPYAEGRYHWNGSTHGRTAEGVQRVIDVPMGVKRGLRDK